MVMGMADWLLQELGGRLEWGHAAEAVGLALRHSEARY